jgi:hypothetical protein
MPLSLEILAGFTKKLMWSEWMYVKSFADNKESLTLKIHFPAYYKERQRRAPLQATFETKKQHEDQYPFYSNRS